MSKSFRRIVTGHNDKGMAIIASDTNPPEQRPMGPNGPRFFEVWNTNGAPATIDDREAQVVQGTSDGRYPVDFYFDPKSGLLLRVVRYSESPLGLNPTQIDYADYREVAGVKMPFRWTITWLSGRSTIELTEVQPNVPIDAAKFAKPKSSAH